MRKVTQFSPHLKEISLGLPLGAQWLSLRGTESVPGQEPGSVRAWKAEGRKETEKTDRNPLLTASGLQGPVFWKEPTPCLLSNRAAL